MLTAPTDVDNDACDDDNDEDDDDNDNDACNVVDATSGCCGALGANGIAHSDASAPSAIEQRRCRVDCRCVSSTSSPLDSDASTPSTLLTVVVALASSLLSAVDAYASATRSSSKY